MARPPKPLEQHVLNGTYRADRHGPLADEGETLKPPTKPVGLGSAASAVWDELTGLLVGVVRDRDAPLLADLCRWWGELKRVQAALAKKNPGTKGYNQVLNAAGTCMDRIDKIASRFGLTPSDRAKLRTEFTGPVKAKVAVKPKTAIDLAGPPVASKSPTRPRPKTPVEKKASKKPAAVPVLKSRPKTALDRKGK